jgi:hypothetical protein
VRVSYGFVVQYGEKYEGLFKQCIMLVLKAFPTVIINQGLNTCYQSATAFDDILLAFQSKICSCVWGRLFLSLEHEGSLVSVMGLFIQ